MFQIGLKKFLCLKQFKNTVSWVCVISNFKGEEIFGTFYGKELQKANQKEIGVKTVIKKKGDNLYVKWKCYGVLFSSWIDKKDIV